MAIDSFPIIYFNMAGEMIYIIDQRLQAQRIDQFKSQRVLNDIVLSVFNPKLICEVFKPHNAITFAVLKAIFEKLVHSSIMRLNEQSMNKLFDLMIMVIKYQLFACPKPSDMITIVDNHFLSIINMIDPKHRDGVDSAPPTSLPPTTTNHDDDKYVHFKDNTVDIVNVVRNQFLFHYQTYDMLQFQLVRYNLMNFLKDIHTRVSIFLRQGIQTDDGQFIIPYDHVRVECECQIPGFIRYFRGSYTDIIRTEHFDLGGQFSIDESRTTLGLNIYNKKDGQEEKNDPLKPKPSEEDGATNQKEIDLLAKLICKKQPKTNDQNPQDVFDMRFEFLNQNQDTYYTTIANNKDNKSVQVIESATDEQLAKIIQDLNEFSLNSYDESSANKSNDPQQLQNNGDDEIDLLELMDS